MLVLTGFVMAFMAGFFLCAAFAVGMGAETGHSREG